MHLRTLFLLVGFTLIILLVDSSHGSSIWKDNRWARRASQDDDYADDADDSMPAEYDGDQDYDQSPTASDGAEGDGGEEEEGRAEPANQGGGAKPVGQRRGGAEPAGQGSESEGTNPANQGGGAKPAGQRRGGAEPADQGTGVAESVGQGRDVAEPADQGSESKGTKPANQEGGGAKHPMGTSRKSPPSLSKLKSPKNTVAQEPPPGGAAINRPESDSGSAHVQRQPNKHKPHKHSPISKLTTTTTPTSTTAKTSTTTTTTTRNPKMEKQNKKWHHRAYEKLLHAGRTVGGWFKRGWNSVFGDADF